MMWMGSRSTALGALLTALLASAGALQCLNRDSLVATEPAGDIAVRYNDPLEIRCFVEPPYHSSQLGFVRLGPNKKKYKAEIVNETTARLYIAAPERQASTYDCQLNAPNVRDLCSMRVVVDGAPEPVTDFQCRSYNLERLVCSWRPPLHYSKTDYFLTYDLHFLTTTLPCNVIRKDNNYSCLFGKNATVYRPQEEIYKFHLTSKNTFGNLTQDIEIDNFAVIIPNKPSNLIINREAHSVLLQWQIPRDIAFFSPSRAPPVEHKIKYQIKTVNNLTQWNVANVSSLEKVNKTTYKYHLDKLLYAHWQYDVRVYIKAWRAPDEDEFWTFEATTFTTLDDRPPRPPLTELGAFQSKVLEAGTRDLRLYWQQLDEYEESGDNFTYIMLATDGQHTHRQSNRSSYAQFRASLLPYNVTITSSNNQGTSANSSYLYIPAASDILEEPTSFTKTIRENGTYDLLWHSPKNGNFDGYTLFWCLHTDSVPSKQCTGKLSFAKLSPHSNNHTITVPEDGTYQFAISANKGTLSSGMVYADCILPLTGAINTVSYFKRGAAIGSRYVELLWDLACAFSEGHVKGYNITYCQVANDSTHCSGNEEHHYPINDPYQNAVNITGLIPHTTYDFKISVIYHDGVGHPSTSVAATTLEEKPSQPLNLQISQVTNESMVVSWDPPALKNGVLQPYIVSYCIDAPLECQEIASERPNGKIRQNVKLQGLQPFSNYTVMVKACTIACSEYALAGVVRLAMGAPSRMKHPDLQETTLRWEPPVERGGFIDFYEIQILKGGKFQNLIQSNDLVQYNVDGCDIVNNHYENLSYQVRAVNLDSEKDHGALIIKGNVTLADMPKGEGRHEGPWSEPAPMTCRITSIFSIIFWSLGGIFAVVFTILTAFGSRKIWHRFKTMTDIGPVLPPGLGPAEDKESSKYPLGSAWSPPSKGREVFPHIANDEVCLLPPPPPPRRTTHSGSSDSTDSTTLSLTSKGPCERDASPCEDNSDDSSVHLHVPVDCSRLPSTDITAGYKKWSDLPTTPNYQEDAQSPSSEELVDPPLPLGYVQTAVLPMRSHHPHQSTDGSSTIFNIPSGYVRAQDATVKPNFLPTSVNSQPQGPTAKPVVQEDPLLATKFLQMDWKLPTMRPAKTEVSKATALSPNTHGPQKSGAGYVSHTDAVMNKHLSIVSGSPLGEEPAMPDPNMSPEAYCRFAWNSDPSADNLDSLLSEEPASAGHIYAMNSSK